MNKEELNQADEISKLIQDIELRTKTIEGLSEELAKKIIGEEIKFEKIKCETNGGLLEDISTSLSYEYDILYHVICYLETIKKETIRVK